MQSLRLRGDVLIALALALLAACSSDPASDDGSAARVCPSKTTRATVPDATGGAALTPVASPTARAVGSATTTSGSAGKGTAASGDCDP